MLALSPPPGTPDASPRTQISVHGVARKRIASVQVTGGQSGRHAGRLRGYSGDRGASFLLRKPLTQGERVKVVVRLRGARTRRFSFGVARLGTSLPVLNLPATQPAKLSHFTSAPALTPPRITVRRRSPRAGTGDVFLTPLPSPIVHPGAAQTISISPVGPGGPMIADRRGRVLWFGQVKQPAVAANLRIQRYRGRRVLTWWQGPVTVAAFGLGEGVIADSTYRTVATVHAGNGYPMDLHELTLTKSGDALFTVYQPVLVHLPGTPAGKLSPLLDAIVQEVDVRTGLVTWEWHALGHIPLAQSYATPANSATYDAFHINAVQALPHDRVLVSARDTSAVYDVDQATGRIRWRLGGKASDFRLARGARFWFQHDARMLPGNRVSLFDDGAGPPKHEPFSRALILRLDPRRHTARVVHAYHRDRSTSAQSEGSAQLLAGGHVFAGFGAEPFLSEFSSGGRLLYDASLPRDDGSYRVLTFPWHARPRTRPAAAARSAGAGTTLWVSWNGATEVRRWQVRAGGRSVASAPWRGFETRIGVARGHGPFVVRALDEHGHVLGASRALSAP